MYFIGIDIGTTSVKILAISETGKIISSLSREYPIYFPQPLWSEQNPEDWWHQTIVGLQELLEKIDKKNVKAISFSGQMHGLVILDEFDNIIRPAILWNDQRTGKECDFLNDEIGRGNLSKWTGNVAITGFTAPKILWLKENEPKNYKKIKKIMLPKDYIVYKMSGIFASDMSDASGTLLLDVKKREWSKEMLDIVGIAIEQLPRLYESYEVVGYLKDDISSKLGLSRDVKIVIGGGDQAVAAVGGGIVGVKSCSVSLGTSGVVYANTEKFLIDKSNRLHSFCNANGKYHVMGVTLSAAGSLNWWVKNINKSEDFNGLLEEVKKTNNKNNSIFFLPYLMGERTPHNDPYCRGTFIGMNMNSVRSDMTQAVLEGVGFSLRDIFEIMKDIGVNTNEVTINGGGARNSIWCQIIADILNVKVNKVKTDDGPAYGAAILAAVGDGLFPTLEDACTSFLEITETFYPRSDRVETYDTKYNKYKCLYPELKDLFINLSE